MFEQFWQDRPDLAQRIVAHGAMSLDDYDYAALRRYFPELPERRRQVVIGTVHGIQLGARPDYSETTHRMMMLEDFRVFLIIWSPDLGEPHA